MIKRSLILPRRPGAGSYDPIHTPQEAYDSGYESGLNWNPAWDYVPGGPFVCHPDRHNRDPFWKAYCDATVINHQFWMSGWHAGNKERLYENWRRASFVQG